MDVSEKNKLLLDYPSKDLLQKFGTGGHKPGSGSAAAFQGMLAAKLLNTVIAITCSDKYKEKYKESVPELLEKDKDLTERVFPRLEELFQKDAVLFDKVIQLRDERDKATDPHLIEQLKLKALEALKPATEILIEIGDNCADIAYYAALVFDKGFKSAKGDSGVALNGAVAALGGCLSIIDLNLSSFGSNQWTVKIREQVAILRADYSKMSLEAKSRMEEFTSSSQTKSYSLAKSELNSGKWEGINLSRPSIEAVANQAVNVLWDFRNLIWEKDIPQLQHEVVKPEIVFEKILGYQFGYASLGYHDVNGTTFQIAGQINKKEKVVAISKDLTLEVRNFTAAHELGHALLHGGMNVLHRDRPLDGSASETKDLKETQANNFASYFLMPATSVKTVFQLALSIEKFALNQNAVFALGFQTISEFKRRYRTLRSASRFVARFKGKTYEPLHKIFHVSAEAMAIRLEELELVQY